ncbi:MAG: hypothetical protein AAGG08_01780, partial [Actinomycetota bacterium]
MLGIVITASVIALVMSGAFLWYRRKIEAMKPTDGPVPSGVRLTAERLRSLPTPPWRIVHEVPDDRLGGADHVAIGPSGVFAIRTVLGDRPTTSGPPSGPSSDP